MHRSLSYYTISKPAPHSQLELAGAVSPSSPENPPRSAGRLPPALQSHAMPRSVSLQRLSFGATASPAAHSTPFVNTHTPFGAHRKSPSFSYLNQQRTTRGISAASVELVDDDVPATATAAVTAQPNVRRSTSERPQQPSPIDYERRTRSSPAAVKSDADDANDADDPLANSSHDLLLEGSSLPDTPSSELSARGGASPLPDDELLPASDSPDLRPTPSHSRPIGPPRIGNALVHPPPALLLGTSAEKGSAHSFSSSLLSSGDVGGGNGGGALHSTSLPAGLVEDFDIVGRAGDNSTCDSWIVRSKFSGKMAVFKPRAGEQWEQRKKYQEEQEEAEEAARRRARFNGGKSVAAAAPVSALSTSCPLTLPEQLRTPLKRGVVYGETTRKEVAAYLMDHEHFAGVPKTLEATLWLRRHQAPNQGIGAASSSSSSDAHTDDHHHPYRHAVSHHGQTMLLHQYSSPDMRPQQPNRLLLQAATASPPLNPTSATESVFAFDADDVFIDPAAAVAADCAANGAPQERSLFGNSRRDDSSEAAKPRARITAPVDTPPMQSRNVRLDRPPMPADSSNLHPPTLLHSPHASAATHASAAAGTAATAVPASPDSEPSASFHSPDLLPLAPAGTSPECLPGLAMGAGLPSSASDLIATYGSLQEYVENGGSAEDMGSNSFSADEVHRIGILDVRLLNLDRHLGNLLVQRDDNGKPHLIPIDHGFILPSYTDLRDVHLEWTYWRQCCEPFSHSTLRYIGRLDPIADAAQLRNLGIRDEALVSMVFSSLLLQHAARDGLTLFHIAQMVQRDGDGEEPSVLEHIVARVLGFQQQQQQFEDGESPVDADGTPVAGSTEARGQRHFDFTSGADLPPVVEVEEELTGSPSTSRQASSAAGTSTFGSPPVTPASVVAPSPMALTMGLLTRSNSDGAMALAEALSRQSSAPLPRTHEEEEEEAAAASSSARMPAHASSLRARRSSVADAAKQLIELVDSTNAANVHSARSSPATGPAATPSYSASIGAPVTPDGSGDGVGSLPLPPPPMLRLGTELSYHEQDAAAKAAGQHHSHSGGGDHQLATTSGAKLQHLLEITERVIQEEIANYRVRNGLLPSTAAATAAAAAAVPPSKSPQAQPDPLSAGPIPVPSPPSSGVFNTTLRSPPPPPAGPTPLVFAAAWKDSPTRSASADHVPSVSALAASLRRTRSTEGLAEAAAGGAKAAATHAVQATSGNDGHSGGVDAFGSPQEVASRRRRSFAASLAHSPSELITIES